MQHWGNSRKWHLHSCQVSQERAMVPHCSLVKQPKGMTWNETEKLSYIRCDRYWLKIRRCQFGSLRICGTRSYSLLQMPLSTVLIHNCRSCSGASGWLWFELTGYDVWKHAAHTHKKKHRYQIISLKRSSSVYRCINAGTLCSSLGFINAEHWLVHRLQLFAVWSFDL